MSLGVALAGGGLKGLAHIGALTALEELGVKIDYLSGTSRWNRTSQYMLSCRGACDAARPTDRVMPMRRSRHP